MPEPLIINDVEIKSAELVEGQSQIETLLMDKDLGFRKGSPTNRVSSQTVLKEADEGIQMLKAVEFTKAELPSAEELKKLVAKRGMEWDEDIPNRVENYYASDERVDRHGDIVRQKWDFKNFVKNPLLLWSHNWSDPPIGSQLDWKVVNRSDADYKGPALQLLSLFASQETYALAADIMRLVKTGILKTGSVGFYPIEILDVKDSKEREKLGLGRWGVIVNKSELVEFSPTSVPANPGAHRLLSMAKSAGGLKPEDHMLLRTARQIELVTLGLEDMAKREDERWCDIWKNLFPDAEVGPIKESGSKQDGQSFEDLTNSVAELQSQIEVLTRGQSDLQEVTDGILANLSGFKGQEAPEDDPFVFALASIVPDEEE